MERDGKLIIEQKYLYEKLWQYLWNVYYIRNVALHGAETWTMSGRLEDTQMWLKDAEAKHLSEVAEYIV